MAIDAVELFQYFSKTLDGVERLPPRARVQLKGTVVGVSLRHDKTAVVSLAGGERGVEKVECRCVSDEVLRLVSAGSTALLEGACAGLEDSVTVVLELCQLLEVHAPSHRWREAPGRALSASQATPAVSAAELFERRAARAASPKPAAEEVVEVAGKVVRTFLRPDKVACASLAADPREMCTVECRFLSDEVLFQLRVGAMATLRGACQGLEDSLTLVLDRCELLAVEEARSGVLAASAEQKRAEALPVRVTAEELFERCSRSVAPRDGVPVQSRFEVTGPVEKTFLKQGVACVSLGAAARGPQTVECRCLSDEVLAVALRGDAVTLRGFLAGFDDSVTLVLERCELARAKEGTRRKR